MQGARGRSLVRELRPHRPQLRVCMPQLKILHAATKTQYSQIHFKKKSKKIVSKERVVSVGSIFLQQAFNFPCKCASGKVIVSTKMLWYLVPEKNKRRYSER